MADAASNVPPSSAPVKSASEDPDTAAARKELKQTAISDGKPDLAPVTSSPNSDDERTSTPDPADGKMKEQISSPKKKRAHAELDHSKDASQSANGDSTASTTATNDSSRDEPEKKRPRDVSSEAKATSESAASADDKGNASPKKSTPEKPKTTSSSAFKVSGMSAFSSASSPFAAAGGKTLSSFASGAGGSASPFAAASQSPGKSTFGSGSALGGGASPFGKVGGPAKTLGASPFASASAPRGSQLTSFGSTGGTFKSSKPAKPFGAPESDVEESGDEGSDDDDVKKEEDSDKPKKQIKDEDKEADDDKSTAGDDKKKAKYQKVATETGEDGEATIFSVRAKIFNLDKTTSSWKERGAGNLKINVPISCVDIDEENGNPIPGSFDASGLEDAGSKVVRLIARQDSTHRVILNTAVIPAMVFQDKPTTKAVCVLFTAVEGEGEAVSIQIKLSAANAKLFINEIGKIQRELQAA